MRRFAPVIPALTLGLGILFSLHVRAQDSDPEAPKAVDEPRPSGFSEDEEKAIFRRFYATEESFTSTGRLRLVYDLKGQPDVALRDWSPELEEAKPRLRWSRRANLENLSGLMFADHGIFVHRALWKGEVQVDVEGTCFGQMKGPQYFAVGIVDEKGRRGFASNLGHQVLQLRGLKIAGARPRMFPETRVRQRLHFGAGVEFDVFSARQAEEKTEHTKELRRFDRFKVAFFWNGDRVQVGVHKLVIEGKIDPDWLKKNP